MAIVARDLHSSLMAIGSRWGQGVPPANYPLSGFSTTIQLYVQYTDFIRILTGFHGGVLAVQCVASEASHIPVWRAKRATNALYDCHTFRYYSSFFGTIVPKMMTVEMVWRAKRATFNVWRAKRATSLVFSFTPTPVGGWVEGVGGNSSSLGSLGRTCR